MAEGTTCSKPSDQEVLTQVEEMATKLLEEEDVAVLMEICKRVIVCETLLTRYSGLFLVQEYF